MSWIDNTTNIDWEKIKHPDLVLLLLGIIFLTTPGVLVTFYFFKEIFNALDGLKLILFSISLLSPLVTINTFMFMVTEAVEGGTKRENLYPSFMLSTFISGLLFYLLVFIGYLGKTFHYAVGVIIAIEIGLTAMFAIGAYRSKKKTLVKNKQS